MYSGMRMAKEKYSVKFTCTTQVTLNYYKEYNVVIKYGLPLKLQLTGYTDVCPPKITMPYIYFNKVMSTTSTLKYVHFNTCHVLISTNNEHKTQHIHYNSQHNP